jgi:hypothetical protein
LVRGKIKRGSRVLVHLNGSTAREGVVKQLRPDGKAVIEVDERTVVRAVAFIELAPDVDPDPGML